MKNLLATAELERSDILALLDLADQMAEVNSRPVKKVPALKGRTVATVFFEDSTRTRLSFETAAKRLSADTMGFAPGSSSVNKGEGIRDTIETLSAMGVDLFVVRHKSSGTARRITEWTDASVVNAGDGWHQHPTQALLDAHVVSREFGAREGLEGLRIAMVGDLRHSRVARSDIDVFTRLGAHVHLVSPPQLGLRGLDTPGASVVCDLDDIVGEVDVLYMLRLQRERMDAGLVPSLEEYARLYALTPDRARRLREGAIVMHPGPMNRGVEMRVDPAALPGSRILDQVSTGVSVRMAVLYSILGGGSAATLAGGHHGE